MKLLILIVLTCNLLFAPLVPVFAQEPTPTPEPEPEVHWMNEFTVEDDSTDIITLLTDFIEGFDSFLGGFIFYTPNPLSETITLKDDSEIPGVGKYRDIFYQIAIPTLAIIIAGIAVTKLGSDNAHELKSFALRLVIVVALFITVPPILSYSIEFNNLLVDKINTTQEFTLFLNTYFEQAEVEISNGESPETFGIPSFDFSLQSGIMREFGKFVVQIFLFAITFLFLLGSFLYIGFQFAIRFATLLFLGVLYPIVIPFFFSERTQGMVYTFFKIWFTFLIQQPAFVLGFAMATDIFTSILTASGPSVGMLFFYTGFLFFLGGVNILVARLFGDAWSVVGNNMQAAIATRSITTPVYSQLGDFKRGLLGGNVGSLLGRQVKNQWNSSKGSSDDLGSLEPSHNGKYTPNGFSNGFSKKKDMNGALPLFSKTLSGRGMDVKVENAKQGVVSVTGEAYRHDDKRTGMSTFYPTRMEAVQDGVPEAKLQKVMLDHDQFIDLSSFSKTNPNPHNFNAMQEAKKQGKELNYAYVTETSPPKRIKQFLDVSQSRNDVYGIKGVIVNRQATQGSDSIIRMYSNKPYEKR